MAPDLALLFDRLWPITRSLTGNGNRETLRILSEMIDLNVTEVPSGTICYDWTVPPEWNIHDAWIKDSNGNKVVDFKLNNLHILGYSIPVSGNFTFTELEPHLFTLPDQPDIIPYLTSYYKRNWGFCLSHESFLQLDRNETYEVYIDTTLDEQGSMSIGEAVIKGSLDEEILFSTYICHPSLANNELSGPLVTSFIYHQLKQKEKLRYTYRFIFLPETIGSIYALSQYGDFWKRKLKAGFVVTCIGDPGMFTYKRSRRGNSLPDRAAELILRQTVSEYNIHNFFPSGSDERQYCSPGFNLPVGSLMRTMYGTYPEYHTSADNRNFISFDAMEESIKKYLEIIELLERNNKYLNKFPYGEPQLGKRGLYPTLGSQKNRNQYVNAIMWILNLSDGEHDLIDISEKSKIPVKDLYAAIESLLEKEVISAVGS
jgi:aminopeptidase-like protein